MVAKGFDAGVRFGEVIAQDMIAVPLGPAQRSAYVAAPEFFRRHPKPASPEELKGLACIRFRFESGRYYAWEFERDGVELSVEVDGQLTLSEQDLAVQAALDGAGIAFAFEAQVEDLIAQGRLVRVLDDWCPYYPGFYLYYPSRRQLPATLRAFVDFARSTAKCMRMAAAIRVALEAYAKGSKGAGLATTPEINPARRTRRCRRRRGRPTSTRASQRALSWARARSPPGMPGARRLALDMQGTTCL